MVLIVAVVLLMYFRTPGTAGTSYAVQCTEQKGIALKWIKPFALCGDVYGVAEGEHPDVLEMHFPLCLEGNCLIACASATVSHVNITFEWCAHRAVPALLLPDRIHGLDLTVDWDNESVTFYGCSKGYRVEFEIGRNVSCIEAACQQIILYASEKSKLPEPYSFHPAYNSGVGLTREKLPAHRVSPLLYRSVRKGHQRRADVVAIHPNLWLIGSFTSFTWVFYLCRS